MISEHPHLRGCSRDWLERHGEGIGMKLVVFNSLAERAWYFMFHPEELDYYRVRNGNCSACAEGKSMEPQIIFTDPISGLNAYAPNEHMEATVEHPDPMRF